MKTQNNYLFLDCACCYGEGADRPGPDEFRWEDIRENEKRQRTARQITREWLSRLGLLSITALSSPLLLCNVVDCFFFCSSILPFWIVKCCKNDNELTLLQAFDAHLNMILGDAEETVTTVEIDDETYEEIYKVSSQVSSKPSIGTYRGLYCNQYVRLIYTAAIVLIEVHDFLCCLMVTRQWLNTII